MPALEVNTSLIYGVHLRESADDGSDFTNAAADYRVLFLGEDGVLHLKDSAGTVTDPGGGTVATDAIWDAAGDLAVGTGANTAARVAIGATRTLLKSNGTTAAWAFPAFIGCRITEATAQSVNDDTETALTCDDADIYDTDAFHDTVTNNTRLTIPTGLGGYYRITAEAFFAFDATAGSRDVKIRLDGATQIALARVPNVAVSVGTGVIATGDYFLSAAQYVECTARHTSGNALNVNLRAFSLHFLGV